MGLFDRFRVQQGHRNVNTDDAENVIQAGSISTSARRGTGRQRVRVEHFDGQGGNVTNVNTGTVTGSYTAAHTINGGVTFNGTPDTETE